MLPPGRPSSPGKRTQLSIFFFTCVLALLILHAAHRSALEQRSTLDAALQALRAQNAALVAEVSRLTAPAAREPPTREELAEEQCAAATHPRHHAQRQDCLHRVLSANLSMGPAACGSAGCCWGAAPPGTPWCFLPLQVGPPPFDVAAMAARGRHYAPEAEAASLLLMTAIDLLQRHEGDWLRQAARPSFASGADLVARYAAALAATSRRVCQAPDVLLVAHLITADDASRLEEWLLWHRALGVDHTVVYLNGPRSDGSSAVLAPFVEAGWASVQRAPPGRGVQQTAAVNEVAALLERKSCHFSGTGDVHAAPDCYSAPPGYAGYTEPDSGRAVWLAPWDTDEFLSLLSDTSNSSACAQDLLRLHGNAAGLATPWVFYGHSNHTTPPPGLLTAAFTHHAPVFETMYKFFLQVGVAEGADFRHGHSVVAEAGGAAAEDELFRPLAGAHHDFSPLTPATARLRLNHHVTGSTQQLLQKWMEGMVAAPSDPWTGTPGMRPAAQIAAWLRLGAEAWTEEDVGRDAGVAEFVARVLQQQ